MSNIQRYYVDWNGKGQLVVEVNHALLTEERLHQMNNFWRDARKRLEEHDGNVLHTVLAMLAVECFYLCIRGCYSSTMLIDEFERGVEGWPLMDGRAGIMIIACNEPNFMTEDITVHEWKEE